MSTTQFELSLPNGARAIVDLAVTVEGDLGHDARRINERLVEVLLDHWWEVEGIKVVRVSGRAAVAGRGTQA